MCCESCEEFDNLQYIINRFFKGVNHKDMLNWKFDNVTKNVSWKNIKLQFQMENKFYNTSIPYIWFLEFK
jgi:hypothetical protein